MLALRLTQQLTEPAREKTYTISSILVLHNFTFFPKTTINSFPKLKFYEFWPLLSSKCIFLSCWFPPILNIWMLNSKSFRGVVFLGPSGHRDRTFGRNVVPSAIAALNQLRCWHCCTDPVSSVCMCVFILYICLDWEIYGCCSCLYVSVRTLYRLWKHIRFRQLIIFRWCVLSQYIHTFFLTIRLMSGGFDGFWFPNTSHSKSHMEESLAFPVRRKLFPLTADPVPISQSRY